MNKKDFAAFLREKRKELNLTQDELAEKLFVSRNIVSRWENGVSYPDLETTQRLAEVLGVEPNEIFKKSSINDNKSAIKPTMIIAPIIGLLILVGLIIIPLATHKDDIITPAEKFNKLAPQYYMDDCSAASENRYYFIQNREELVYYDLESSEIKSLFKLADGVSKRVWYYNDRLYMLESNSEGERIVSYNLEGKDKRNHASFNQKREGIASICFNAGYLYYAIIEYNSEPNLKNNLQVYRIAIDDSSESELLASYPFSSQGVEITLTAMPQMVYINLKYSDMSTGKNTYILDYYEVATNKTVRAFQSNSELNPYIVGWNREDSWGSEKMHACLFDEQGNMYYATAVDSQYVIHKFNVYTKKQEEFYSIRCNTYIPTGTKGVVSDAESIQLQGFDGKYFYITRGVNETKPKADYVEDNVIYGPNNTKKMTTKVNTNYVYVLDLDGNCVDVEELRAQSIDDDVYKQRGNLPIILFAGNAHRLIMKVDNYSNKNKSLMYEGSVINGDLVMKLIQ